MHQRSLPVLETRSGDRTVAAAHCQLELMPEFVCELRSHERFLYFLRHHGRRLMRRAVKVLRDPNVVLRKLGLRPKLRRTQTIAPPAAPRREGKPLQAGEFVRVRPPEEIALSLDAAGKCEGMSYLGIVMDRFAGKTFRVRRRIDYFFDERRWKMFRLRNTVILDGAFCEPAIDAGVPWAGCSRSCFLFWKETWLERVDPDATAT